MAKNMLHFLFHKRVEKSEKGANHIIWGTNSKFQKMISKLSIIRIFINFN